MKIKREDRLSGEFQREIYEIITNKLKNPYITEMFSILRVDVTRDLAHANVYVSVYSGSNDRKQKTFDEINASAKQIRYELAKVMKCRTVPELHFILDGSMEYSDKMNKIFKEISKDKKED